jgi:hypothetical protein
MNTIRCQCAVSCRYAIIPDVFFWWIDSEQTKAPHPINERCCASRLSISPLSHCLLVLVLFG